jgi:uncharacterized membrane protein (GlpM family)
MDDFILKVILSFLVGGLYVGGVVWLSERLGSRIGGAFAGLPSTILVSLIFISITEGAGATQIAVAIIPLMLLASLMYAFVFLEATTKFKKPKRYPGAILAATIAWFLAALLVKAFSNISFFALIILTLCGLIVFNYWFRHFTATAPVKIPLPSNIYLLRFLSGGAVIAGAVVTARYLGPVWGGIVSSFPAMLGSILYFLNKSQGEVFLRGFLRGLPFSYISMLIFIILIYLTITRLSIYFSFVIAIAGSLFYTFLLIVSKNKQKSLYKTKI